MTNVRSSLAAWAGFMTAVLLAGCGGALEDEGPFVATTSAPLCASATLSATQVGSVVSLTAGSACATAPEFRFFVRFPGAPSYTPLGDYGSSNTAEWDSAGQPAGRYHFLVYVREAGSVARYETYVTTTSVFGAVCTGATLTAAAGTGSTVNLSATAVCPGGLTPEYRFLVRAPGAVSYTEVRPYGTAATFSWDAAGWPVGRTDLLVYVRAAGNSSSYEAYRSISWTIGAVCSAATLTAAAGAGSMVNLSATATCAGGTTPEYQFLVRAPGAATYTEVRPYGAAPTFSWDASGWPAGRSDLLVYVRAAGNTSTYEAYRSASWTIGSVCTAATLSAVRGTGTLVELAATATCAGGTTAEYQFLARAPGATAYTEIRPYGSAAAFTWDTAGLASGKYDVLVYVRRAGNTSSYEAFATRTALVGQVCTSAGLTATPRAPGFIDLTAAATCEPGAAPEFRFFVRFPGGSLLRDVRLWSTTPNHTVNTATLPASGRYDFFVYVRATGNTSAYEASATTSSLVGAVCNAATLTVTPGAGRMVNLSATATCTAGATPQYQFLLRRAGTTSLLGVRSFGPVGEYALDTTPLPAGTHLVAVYVRATGNNSTYEGYASKPLVVQ